MKLLQLQRSIINVDVEKVDQATAPAFAQLIVVRTVIKSK